MGIPKKFINKLVEMRMTLTEYLSMLNKRGVLSDAELEEWLLRPVIKGIDLDITKRIQNCI